jgi:hypothetical protein
MIAKIPYSAAYSKLPGCCQYDREAKVTVKQAKSKKKQNGND